MALARREALILGAIGAGAAVAGALLGALALAGREVFAAKGAEIVGIGIDQAAKVEEFARTYGVTYPVLIAEADAIELMRRLGNALGGLPYTVVVDRVGAVAHRRLGALTRAEVEGVLEGLLR